jgi:hypothetical protein
MIWEKIKRLIVPAPQDRWGGEPVVAVVAVGLGLWVGITRNSMIVGFAVAVIVSGLAEMLIRLFVKRRRGP